MANFAKDDYDDYAKDDYVLFLKKQISILHAEWTDQCREIFFIESKDTCDTYCKKVKLVMSIVYNKVCNFDPSYQTLDPGTVPEAQTWEYLTYIYYPINVILELVLLL